MRCQLRIPALSMCTVGKKWVQSEGCLHPQVETGDRRTINICLYVHDLRVHVSCNKFPCQHIHTQNVFCKYVAARKSDMYSLLYPPAVLSKNTAVVRFSFYQHQGVCLAVTSGLLY